METRLKDAKFGRFKLSKALESVDATVAVPISNGIQQRYFFVNLRSGRGLTVMYPKRPGLLTMDSAAFVRRLASSVKRPGERLFPMGRALFRRYHNGMSFLELLYRHSKPHGITYIGEQRYLASLCAESAYFVIDLKNERAELRTLGKERSEVFSTYQYYDETDMATYFATQEENSGAGEFAGNGRDFTIPTRIMKYRWPTGEAIQVWSGMFDPDVHHMGMNKTRRYLGMVSFGDFFDDDKKLLPSKILILDLMTDKEWWIDNAGWSPSAHIDWDPTEPDVCYLSCHNGVITPMESQLRFFFQKTYRWKIFGPASVHKYRITELGPRKIGIFTHPEMFRMTVHRVFLHRGKRLLACTGFPNFIFIADADTMELKRKVAIKEKTGRDSFVGSLSPTPDGEKICLVTAGTLQMVDVESGEVQLAQELGKVYDPFNHMAVVSDTDW
jgi:hypothetical protein